MGILKIILIGVGVLAALLCAELALRGAGVLYYRAHVRNIQTADTRSSRSTRRILCVGDSFTFGWGAAPGKSYPDHLARKLADAATGYEWEVRNIGIPAQNSSQVLNRLQNNIDTYKPDILVVLTGNNNDEGNLADSNVTLFVNQNAWKRCDTLLNKLRIYAIARKAVVALWMRLLTHFHDRNVDESAVMSHPDRHAAPSKYNEIMTAIESMQRMGLRKDILPLCREAIALDWDDPRAHVSLAEYYSDLNPRDYRSSIQEYRAILTCDPRNHEACASLWKMYYFDGDVESALRELRAYLEIYPQDKASYQSLLDAGLPDLKDQEIFLQLRLHNLQGIIDVARRNNVLLILMDYPFGEHPFIRYLSVKNNVRTITHKPVFDTLIEQGKYTRTQLFLPDGHCTDTGYGIMAEQLFLKLKEWGIIR